MKKILLTLLCSLVFSLPAAATVGVYEFSSQAEEARYRKLIEELRCPKCQNQNIADSNAPISIDLRDETYRLMTKEEFSNEQIVDFLVERYGDFVRYKPPMDKRTLVLWFGPLGLLAFGLLMLAIIVLRRRGTQAAGTGQLSGEEQQRLSELLNQSRDTAEK